ncbi:MAG: FAD-dependent oxidoreductase, partial [Clostridia bacterium]|nr:FAD-dependent oxidoreductase [Clostridia bacterium]
AFHTAGGVLMYGIPEFRLPKDIVQKEIANLKDMGVDIQTNVIIGKTIMVDELFDEMGYYAVYIGSGAGLPSFMGLEGESLNGVYSANEFLTRINLMKGYKFPEYDTPVYVGKNVAVLGGGNVAMDAARSAKRLGADNVYIVYRRGKEELPARAEEVMHAEEEGIIFKLLQNPTKFVGNEDGWVTGMEVIKMELGEPDASGRRRPVPIEGSEELLDIDTVVVAIGQTPNPLIRKTTKGLDTNQRGCIIANEETGKTSKDHVYAGGDVVTGAATVILAMGAGKAAAEAIDKELNR